MHFRVASSFISLFSGLSLFKTCTIQVQGLVMKIIREMWSYLIDHYQKKACFVESGGWPLIEIPACIQVELKIAYDI